MSDRAQQGTTREGIHSRHWRRFRCFGDFVLKPRPHLCRPMPQELAVLEDALTTPRVIGADRGYGGGVYSAAGELMTASVRPGAELGHHHAPDPLPLPAPATHEPDPAIYLGSLMLHFGHFLLEVAPRLWALDQRALSNVYFHAWRGAWREPPPFFTETLRALTGSAVKVRLIERPTRFARLLVPSPTFTIGFGGSPEFQAWCQGFAQRVAREPDPAGPERIYCTRRGLGSHKRRLEREEEIEALFAARGFAVLQPETLPFFEQLRLMRACRVLAGCEGSALHLALFMPPGGAVVGLDFRYNRNQMAVEAMGGHHALHLLCLKLSGKTKHSEDDLMSFDPAFRPLLERELDALLADLG